MARIDVASFPKNLDALLLQRMNARRAAELRADPRLKVVAKRQLVFEAAVRSRDHLVMSEVNEQFRRAIAMAGRTPYLASFYAQCWIRVAGCFTCISSIWSGPMTAAF